MLLWREINGYGGKYFISNDGRVMSKHDKHGVKDRILKPYLRCKKAPFYYAVALYDTDGKRKNVYVHRLIAEAFIPNPNGLPEINHKDKNTFNNSIDNLEWCTHATNVYHERRKEVEQLENGVVVALHHSVKEACQQSGIGYKTMYDVLKGRRSHVGNYEWRYAKV